jgi:hypothetical protein
LLVASGGHWGVNGTASLAADTSVWESWDVYAGSARRQATKITLGGGNYPGAFVNLEPSAGGQGWSGKHVFVTMYLHEGVDGETTDYKAPYGIRAWCWAAANQGGGMLSNKRLWSPSYAQTMQWPGWHTFYCETEDVAAIKSVTFVRENTSLPTQTGPSWTFDRLSVYDPPAEVGYITFQFDRGFKEQFSAARMLAAAGISGQFNVSPTKIDQSGSMTLEELRQVKAMGHRVCCYPSGVNPNAWTSWMLSEPETRLERLLYNQQWLRDHGLADGTSECVISTPSGGYDWDDFQLMYGKHYLCITGTTAGWTPTYTSPYVIEKLHGYVPYIVPSIGTIAEHVDGAAATKQWLCTLWHLASGYTGTPGALEACLDEAVIKIADGTLKAVTIPDVLEGNL